MKKWYKFLLSIICVLLLSGCTAEYNVEIYNDEVRVDGFFVEQDTSKWNTKVYDIPYHEMIDLKVEGDDNLSITNGIYKISTDSKLGIGLKNTYKLLNEYENSSPAIKACYQYFNVFEEDDKIVISTSLENKCFDSYPMLDEITVNLKTNHKVVSNNADIVDGYHYTWNLNRSKKDDAAILITLKKDEYVFNYENEFVKKMIYIGAITGIILGISGITYLYFKNKNRKINEI